MKILVVSDTHGNDSILFDLYKQYPNMDYYLHAGDSQSSSMAIYPYDSILGNCDFYYFDRLRKIYTPKGYILMKHFPTINSKEMEDVKFFIHGHTHRYELKEENGLIIICPGSPTLPRDGTNGTYVIMDINDKYAEITVIELETKNILTSLKIM